MLPRLKMIPPFFYLIFCGISCGISCAISCAISCHFFPTFLSDLPDRLDWFKKKWNKLDIDSKKFQSFSFFGKKQLLLFFYTLFVRLHLFQNKSFPSMLSCYETPILYIRTFFSTNLMKNSDGFWTSNFHKVCGRFDKKESLKSWAFSVEKNLSHHQPCGINDDVFHAFSILPKNLFFLALCSNSIHYLISLQSQKNFNCVVFLWKRKKLEISTKIFWTIFVLETLRWLI